MMRLIDSKVLLVCSVASARWPVSAMVSAAAMVSRSRISPIRITSGSWRRTYFSAAVKLLVSVLTSRWLTMHFLCWCMYSIGSSMVMMWPLRVRLMVSTMAASVVDLPLPVGPVTRTRPCVRLISSRHTGGRPSSSKEWIWYGIWRMAMLVTPRCMKTLARKRLIPWMPNEKSSSRSFSNRFFCSSLRML